MSKKKSKKPAKKTVEDTTSRRFLKFILKWGFLSAIWSSILILLVLFYYCQDLPVLSDMEKQSGKEIVQINYSNGSRITNHSEIYSNEVSFYELPQHLVNAVVATEDRRFFSHHGVDFLGILRAAYVNHASGRIVQGGSTITQQLAKLLFLSPDRNFKRKIQEVLLSFQLERRFTKEQIFTLYLNRAYFGAGSYGVADAAKRYFNKDVSELNLNESALIAGLLKAPSRFSPENNRDLAEDRAATVIKVMVDAGFLNETNLKEIDQDVNYSSDRAQRLYFADMIFEQFRDFLSKKDSKKKSFRIFGTLDEEVQNKLEKVLGKFIEKNNKKLGKSQIAVVIMAKDGAVLGIAGGRDYQKSQFNRALYAKRQSGSAFKTFVYLAAFEDGLKSDDVVEDKKVNVGTWLPDNYDDRYFGEVTLKEAFAKSLNSVSIQLERQVGGEKIAKIARKAGILSKIDVDDPTIALGTTGVSLFELTSAYATIANGGSPVIPYIISEIRDNDDRVLYQRNGSEFASFISEESEENIKQLLREVVVSGTGRNANINESVHGKTGTSQDFRDAWFMGFDDRYVAGVWIGNDDNSPTNKITGGSLPAKLFAEILSEI